MNEAYGRGDLPIKFEGKKKFAKDCSAVEELAVKAHGVISDGARGAGLVFGVYPVRPLNNAYEIIVERRSLGLNGSMQFTYRNPRRSTSPDGIIKGAKSIVTFALPIVNHEDLGTTILPHLLARYARRDYYGILRHELELIREALGKIGVNSKVVLDSNELVDKEVAVRSGIGSYLKNSLVNVSGYGSAAILGNIVVDVALPRTKAKDRLISCGKCRICIDSCPTGAIGDNGSIDARRCISWLLQCPEDLDPAVLPMMGVRLYGCDICQEVCPINRQREDSVKRTFSEVDATSLEILQILTSSDQEIFDLLPHIYIYKRDLRLVRRNAIIAAANLGGGSTYEVEIVREVKRLAEVDPLYLPYVDYFFSTRRLKVD
ncbi:MAG: hypothetical protein M0Z45_06400 [Actinomycetota bacterium]|nr:hypothetical protein [Actinomycetota bacterium]